MWIGLGLIVGSYGLCVALIHLYYAMSKWQTTPPQRVIVVTSNNQQQVEWVLRSLFFSSWLRGRTISATIIDTCSTDDTLKIIERLAYQYSLEVHRHTSPTPLDEIIRNYPHDLAIVCPRGAV
ncbi:glycosyltransferase family A protein [Paenibacillus sp. KN14-4R]|uniref:glycosyltransferase family A protein n=1 Tax=Paenibacillus sp. KN14-4R TaxID=3445773 RepID=UPI003F9F1A9B